MLFWAIAIGLGMLCAAILARPLSHARRTDADVANLGVYKDQLAEIDGDLRRGVLREDEAEALRLEISRRLLATADGQTSQATPAPPRATRIGLALILLAVFGGGLSTYHAIGVPGAPDRPLAERLRENAEAYARRPSQSEMRAELERQGGIPTRPSLPAEQAELLDQLRRVLEVRTYDIEGHRLLVSSLARRQDWQGAAETQAQIIRILGVDADSEEFADLAEFMILAVNGYVSPQAEEELRRSLTLNPQNPRGRYYSGLGAIQAGRVDLAYDLWIRLLSESPPDAPWAKAITTQIGEVALAAGRRVPTPPSIPAGPTAEDIETARDMRPEDREQMIVDMVARLSQRLADDGGPAEDWARLIRAYGVLGERAKANEIWGLTQDLFSEEPAAISLLRQAARDAEVSQ